MGYLCGMHCSPVGTLSASSASKGAVPTPWQTPHTARATQIRMKNVSVCIPTSVNGRWGTYSARIVRPIPPACRVIELPSCRWLLQLDCSWH